VKTERDETTELLVSRKPRKDMRRRGRFPSGLSVVPFFPRTGNDLPARSARPTSLRGHGHGRCDSDPRVLFEGRRADKPLKGPVSPSSKVYQLLPGYTSRTTTTATTTTITTAVTPYQEKHFHPAALFVFKPLRTSFSRILHVPIARPSLLISAPFTSPRWEWKK